MTDKLKLTLAQVSAANRNPGMAHTCDLAHDLLLQTDKVTAQDAEITRLEGDVETLDYQYNELLQHSVSQEKYDTLTAIVDRLPLTADKVRVAPGDTVFWNSPTGITSGQILFWKDSSFMVSTLGGSWIERFRCYSTRTAATAAATGEKGDGDG